MENSSQIKNFFKKIFEKKHKASPDQNTLIQLSVIRAPHKHSCLMCPSVILTLSKSFFSTWHLLSLPLHWQIEVNCRGIMCTRAGGSLAVCVSRRRYTLSPTCRAFFSSDIRWKFRVIVQSLTWFHYGFHWFSAVSWHGLHGVSRCLNILFAIRIELVVENIFARKTRDFSIFCSNFDIMYFCGFSAYGSRHENDCWLKHSFCTRLSHHFYRFLWNCSNSN